MRLLVFADSLAFYGPSGPVPADDPGLWPNVAAHALGGSAEMFAGLGWTARDAFWSLTGDPRVWPELPKADALVLGVGSMDTLPSPLPTYLRQGIRYLRPDPVRRRTRAAYLAAQPVLARLLRPRPVALPAELSVSYLDRMLMGIRALRPELPAVGILPPPHRAASYGFVHDGRAPADAALRAWGERRAVPLLDLSALVSQHLRSGAANPDGMHWGWEGHELVGTACAELLSSAAPARPSRSPAPASTP